MISVTISSDLPSEAAAQWDDLAARSPPNIFMSPAALQAAQATGFANIRILSAWEQGTGDARKLVGWWALRVRRMMPFWPAVLEALPYKYSFLSNPVIDAVCVEAVVPALLAAVRASRFLPKVVRLPSFNIEDPNAAAVRRVLAEQGATQLILESEQRPMVTRDAGVKRSGSTRKKLRQDWNRLSAEGAVDVVNPRHLKDVRDAFEDFLKLEMASWKGANGTALLSARKDAAFVRELIGNLAAEKAVSVALLRIDGKPIAAQVLMYCGTTAYTWKTAYDAAFGRFSPGALLVDKVTEELFSSSSIQSIDSCAAEASFMGQIWSGRRGSADLLIDLGPGRSLAFRLEAARARCRMALRDLRDRLRAAWAKSKSAPLRPAEQRPAA